jgi:thiamine biosynthesis lipoprotein
MEVPFLPTFRFTHFAMSTNFEVVISGRVEATASQVAKAMFDEIDRIENLFSRFRPESEISQINRLKPGESLSVSAEVYECMKAAAVVQGDTDGAFDINVRSLGRSGDKIQESGARHVLSVSPCLDISQSSGSFDVSLKNNPEGIEVDLDLGGIGKGFALDKCLDILSVWSVERALLHGGTSAVLAVGTPSDAISGWLVGVAENWECPDAVKKVMLKDRAFSGSGTDKKGEHIIDPKTGIPARGHLAAYVSHPSAAVADALSTAFMVMDTDEVEEYCDRDNEVWALVITSAKICRVFNHDIFL